MISVKKPEVRHFQTVTAMVKTYRHYMQHLDKELSKDPPNTFPVWGSLSWVDEVNDQKSHTLLLGARLPGIGYESCVYDRARQKWVSKVSLSVTGSSFNFDSVYEAAVRFRNFIMPALTEALSGRLETQQKLPIITAEVRPLLSDESGADRTK